MIVTAAIILAFRYQDLWTLGLSADLLIWLATFGILVLLWPAAVVIVVLMTLGILVIE
jgi:hypothetical protein